MAWRRAALLCALATAVPLANARTLRAPGLGVAVRPRRAARALVTGTAADLPAPHAADGAAEPNAPRRVKRAMPLWPRFDALDRSIASLAIPAAINLAIFPLAGAVDVYWVGRMGDARVLAGMGAANQVFSTLFWLIAFLPSVTTPIVADAIGKGDSELATRRVCEALLLGLALGMFGFALVQLMPRQLLRLVTPEGSDIFQAARPYLTCRGLSFAPALFSAVGFAVFRAHLDAVTPLMISLLANIINCVLDPILIFNMGMGVAGAGLATAVSDVVSFALFFTLMLRRKMARWSLLRRIPSWRSARRLFVAGGAVQLRSVSLQAAFLVVARTVTHMDASGVSAAAHQITSQFWQLGGIALLAISNAASALIPSIRSQPNGGQAKAACAADRLLLWGGSLGTLLGGMLLLLLPHISRLSPLPEVQAAAKPLATFAALLQPLVGIVFAGEGVMQGLNCFGAIAVLSSVAAASMVAALQITTKSLGLSGVWLSFFVFNFVRLLGVLRHHLRAGPLAGATRALPADIAAPPTVEDLLPESKTAAMPPPAGSDAEQVPGP